MTSPRPSRLTPLLAGLVAGAILAGAGLALATAAPGSALPEGSSRPLNVSIPPTLDIPPAPDHTTDGAAPRAKPSTRAQAPIPPKAAPPDARRSRVGPSPAQVPARPARPARQAPADTIAAVVAATNTERVAAGCQALRVDDRINIAAQRHSADMASRTKMSHVGRDGSRFTDRLLAAGYPRPGAENIAFGQPTAASVVAAWMASSGHRRNILNCGYTATGVGYDPRGNYWTQNFGF